MIEIQFDAAGGAGLVHRVGAKPVYLGRNPTNDLVLTDATVSGRHASMWVTQGVVWLEDLTSRNGTFVNGERVRGVSEVVPGDQVRLGETLTFAVRGDVAELVGIPLLEDLSTGIRYSFPRDRFVIGGEPGADLFVEGADTVTLLIHPEGDVYLGEGADDTERELTRDEVFEACGRRFALRDAGADDLAVTIDVKATAYPYTLRVTLNGARGAEATLVNPARGREHTIDAENRAVFLYVLGNKLREDRDQGLTRSEAGWCWDAELAGHIWGKTRAAESHLNNLGVLLCRVRADLKKAGFDPWCIEKRKRHIRVRVDRIEVT